MGTRHLTIVKDHEGEDIIVMYGQLDGYPTGHGKDLKNFLDGFKICNGYTCEDITLPKAANGMECLAAQIVAHFKNGRIRRDGSKIKPVESGFYLHPSGTRDCDEEYIYTITHPIDQDTWYKWDEDEDVDNDVPLHLEVRGGRMSASEWEMKILYSGPISEFDPEAAMKHE